MPGSRYVAVEGPQYRNWTLLYCGKAPKHPGKPETHRPCTQSIPRATVNHLRETETAPGKLRNETTRDAV
jgi:hypothetical protein